MGVFGGVSGALFVKINAALTTHRQRFISSKPAKVLEVALISFLTTSVGFVLIWLIDDCSPIAYTTSPNPLKLMCADNEFNSLSSLLFTTPERSLRTLFHDPPSSFKVSSLIIFFMIYYFIACITYGLAVPAGLFIPSLLIGASWGRVVGSWMNSSYPSQFPDPGKFALIGAAAQLGGIVRMTLSLTVILMEATGNVIVGLPLLMTLIVAKYTGDYLSETIIEKLTDEDLDLFIDFRPYMCEAPYSVPELRGMITRKDLCRFRFEAYGDAFRVEELAFSRKITKPVAS
ncbi:H(+)/Cl(-) exchange transporter 7 [Fasciolopsis buskii]|uniref:H(+)/Cl(-) exchange transporter 7 n=1 Tax=Fasciolopsis buskii TaxID=27845 RepID=A0A8E0RWL4_9TREM|nr:H(+)/Cl(-) exchange transporter 7 [Fasciolopsis buski]